jgi:hypothetical protein
MLTTVLMFVAAVSLSAIAGYYSVLGMASIFAGSAIAVMLMTATLEASKVIVASWLYNNWKQTPILLKSYLTVAVVVLMLITSIGIFGYLSKAHIEQTLQAQSNFEQIEKIEQEIARQETSVAKLENEITALENKSVNNDSGIQQQIDQEQARIDSAYARIQPAIDEQNAIISKEEARLGTDVILYKDLVETINKNLQSVEENIASNNIRAVQALVGVKADGELGPATERAIEAFRSSRLAEKQRLTDLIATESKNITSPVIDAAREEIKRLRANAEAEIKNSNELINRLRSQIGTIDTARVEEKIVEIEQTISTTNAQITQLIEQKAELETEYRKIEAEVGPIKFVAQMIYGPEVDQNLLEDSVRYMILILIFVFDPLAMLMLIASNQGMREIRERWALKKSLNNQKPVVQVEPPQQPVQSEPKDDVSVEDQTILVDTTEEVQFTSSVEQPTTMEQNSTVIEPKELTAHSKTDELLMRLQTSHQTRLQNFKTKD